MARALHKNTTLTTLVLGSFDVGLEGVEAFAEVLRKNNTLKILDLQFDNIGLVGGNILVEALHENRRLAVLNLYHCRFKPQEQKLLKKASRNIITFKFEI